MDRIVLCLLLCLLRLFALRKRLRRTQWAIYELYNLILTRSSADELYCCCVHYCCRYCGVHTPYMQAWYACMEVHTQLSYHSYDGISYSYTSTNHHEVHTCVSMGSSEFLVPLNKERTPNKTKTQNNCTYGYIHVFCVSRIQAPPHIWEWYPYARWLPTRYRHNNKQYSVSRTYGGAGGRCKVPAWTYAQNNRVELRLHLEFCIFVCLPGTRYQRYRVRYEVKAQYR